MHILAVKKHLNFNYLYAIYDDCGHIINIETMNGSINFDTNKPYIQSSYLKLLDEVWILKEYNAIANFKGMLFKYYEEYEMLLCVYILIMNYRKIILNLNF